MSRTPAPEPNPQTTKNDPATTPSPKKNKAKLGWFILGLMVLALLLAVAVGLFLKDLGDEYVEGMEKSNKSLELHKHQRDANYDSRLYSAHFQQMTHHHCPWLGDADNHPQPSTMNSAHAEVSALLEGIRADIAETTGTSLEDVKAYQPKALRCWCMEDLDQDTVTVQESLNARIQDKAHMSRTLEKIVTRLHAAGYIPEDQHPAGDKEYPTGSYILPDTKEKPLDVTPVSPGVNVRGYHRIDATRVKLTTTSDLLHVRIDSACAPGSPELVASGTQAYDDMVRENGADVAALGHDLISVPDPETEFMRCEQGYDPQLYFDLHK
ncbi:hypothetical protein [Corynebacterium aquilae]|uniref:Uncharacterized protein n=1 Tax=Corynebacterium aquilae DSM 44791 TaxID=1431546 RepID=A0A1L7CEZ9_9CORY|nr:hypothetical protein [Corynebacterium aquilae]APT84394.1 hypothetical protein CAQU_04145 [Corynebacterium aquilae DSM 44791]